MKNFLQQIEETLAAFGLQDADCGGRTLEEVSRALVETMRKPTSWMLNAGSYVVKPQTNEQALHVWLEMLSSEEIERTDDYPGDAAA